MRTDRTRRAFSPTSFDRLESREVLSQMGAGAVLSHAHHLNRAAARAAVHVAPSPAAIAARATPATLNGGRDMADVKNGPMADLGQDLIGVYLAFQKNSDSAALAAAFPQISFQGDKVGINIRVKGDLNSAVATFQNLGMTITQTSATYATMSGYAPVSALPAIAQAPQTVSGQAQYKPSLNDSSLVGVYIDPNGAMTSGRRIMTHSTGARTGPGTYSGGIYI